MHTNFVIFKEEYSFFKIGPLESNYTPIDINLKNRAFKKSVMEEAEIDKGVRE